MLKPLYSNCPDCRDHPTHRTRQKAVAQRPALAWRQCCAKHAPLGVGKYGFNAHETESVDLSPVNPVSVKLA